MSVCWNTLFYYRLDLSYLNIQFWRPWIPWSIVLLRIAGLALHNSYPCSRCVCVMGCLALRREVRSSNQAGSQRLVDLLADSQSIWLTFTRALPLLNTKTSTPTELVSGSNHCSFNNTYAALNETPEMCWKVRWRTAQRTIKNDVLYKVLRENACLFGLQCNICTFWWAKCTTL